MERIQSSPRPNWQSKVEELGLTYHTPNGQKYWNEAAFYKLTSAEVDALEKAGNELHELCLKAAQKIIDENRFEQLGIPERAKKSITQSWDREDFSLYGRFDLALGEDGQFKMLEYNADTPTALVEAAVAQWYWLEETHRGADQFNSIHEHLVQAWKDYKSQSDLIYVASVQDNLEDEQTVLYLQDTCHQAGRKIKPIFMDQIGFHNVLRRFVDLDNLVISDLFKLFPWEWMWHSEFAPQLELEVANFIEPMWKMLLSNKGILPVLWEMFPDHPNLLPAYFSAEEFKAREGGWTDHVIKPKLSREGANITVIEKGWKTKTEGEYGEEGFVWQTLAKSANFSGNYPVFGVWIANYEACGLGIREDTTRITGNLSRFIPHWF